MSFDDQELLAEFRQESLEHLADVEGQLLAIELGGANIDVDLVNTVFRAVHSIKGASGFLGLTTISELSHHLENVLNLMRNRELVPNSTITDVLLKAADVLAELVEDISASGDVDVSQHVEALKQVASGQTTVTPQEESTVANNDAPAANVANNEVTDSQTPDAAPSQNAEDSIADRDAATTPASQPVTSATGDSSPTDQLGAAAVASAAVADANIRVSVSVLDRLINLAGELVLGRNQLLQTISTEDRVGIEAVGARIDQVTSELQEAIMLTRMQPIGNAFSKFPRVIRDLSKQLGKQCDIVIKGQEVELDKTIIEAIGDPLTHLIRNAIDHGVESPEVRQAAGKSPKGKIVLQAFHQAGKVNITLSDDGSGIDAEKLKEKAVAKGVITQEKASSMSQREAVRLIFHPGFSMAKQLTDVSGRGVGMDVVKTNIEGLGGTVDVDTEIGAGTTIHVKLPLTLAIIPSLVLRSGKGRFAIPQVNISELVRIKASEISAKIGRIKSAEVLRLRGNLLPLVRLDQVIGTGDETTETVKAAEDTAKDNNAGKERSSGEQQRQETADQALNIIVVEAGLLHYGLIVDELFDSEEIVVKPLGRHMKSSPCLAGATILGDGQVALILDITGIATHTNLQAPEADDSQECENLARKKTEDRQAILLITNHPDEYFGIPMGQIARIERVRSEQIDSVGGQQLLQYRGGSLSLLSLEDHVTAKPRPDQPRLYIVVAELDGREIGLIVPRIMDIREIVAAIDTVTMVEPGVAGSVVVDEMTIRLVDLFDLASVARPELFKQGRNHHAGSGQAGAAHSARILLAEDSDFFRKQVGAFLTSSGYEVIKCEDGEVAWSVLQDVGDQIDLVVTDIEMPNLDGFGLCQRIKADSSLSHLPVIALTSLAGEADMQRGVRCGIDDYQVKMDRDKLLASIFLLIAGSGQSSAQTHEPPIEHQTVGAGS